MGAGDLMGWFDRIVWTAVLATLFCVASIVAGLFGAPTNIWAPLGMTGVMFAVLNIRATR